ncbi:hypothetical protein VP01_233g8 [Puccinia sorghi]|uniref:DDE Tnp4 domain-containing protein n=1 Tax=Puccinia sorghi TaxID=27349 RepID=A0A0L6V7K4_9BASI|nr:hypothetical protein VP01_233g8 [Puccinia sorghi]
MALDTKCQELSPSVLGKYQVFVCLATSISGACQKTELTNGCCQEGHSDSSHNKKATCHLCLSTWKYGVLILFNTQAPQQKKTNPQAHINTDQCNVVGSDHLLEILAFTGVKWASQIGSFRNNSSNQHQLSQLPSTNWSRTSPITAHKALICMFISLPGNNVSAAEEITSIPRFLPYFTNCIGPVDGSHIPVFVHNQKCYINRKGHTSQKILAQFNSLKIPDGKWLLDYASFPLCDTCLILYCGTKYHLREWDVLGVTKHSSSQNVIERMFGVVKKRFKVFETGCQYNIKIQVKVIILMTFLHNFIRVNNPEDKSSLDQHIEELGTCQQVTVEYGELHHTGITQVESPRASSKCDKITQKMWDDCQHHLWYFQRHGHGQTTAL